MAKRYPELNILGQFAYDVGQRETMGNKELARELFRLGYVDEQGDFVLPNLRFLEKVDVNGKEMHELWRFLKRQSPIHFIPRYGMASRIHEPRTKFLLDRYGQVKHHYGPTVELALIEQDVKALLSEEWS